MDLDSIVVHVTPVGRHQKLFVEKIRDNSVYISSEKIGERLDYFYNIYGKKVNK